MGKAANPHTHAPNDLKHVPSTTVAALALPAWVPDILFPIITCLQAVRHRRCMSWGSSKDSHWAGQVVPQQWYLRQQHTSFKNSSFLNYLDMQHVHIWISGNWTQGIQYLGICFLICETCTTGWIKVHKTKESLWFVRNVAVISNRPDLPLEILSLIYVYRHDASFSAELSTIVAESTLLTNFSQIAKQTSLR